VTIEELIEDLMQAAENYGRYSEASHYAKGSAKYLVNEKSKEWSSEMGSCRRSLLNALVYLGVIAVDGSEVDETLRVNPLSSTPATITIKPKASGGSDDDM
jgi:hypothetical protein